MEIGKGGKIRIEGDKIVARANAKISLDTDQDGKAILEANLSGDISLDAVEAMHELSKSSNSALLKQILPFAEIIVKSALAANQSP